MNNYWHDVAINLHYIASIISPIFALLSIGSGMVGLVYFISYMKSTAYQPSAIPKIINILKKIFFLSLCFSVIFFSVWVFTPGGQ